MWIINLFLNLRSKVSENEEGPWFCWQNLDYLHHSGFQWPPESKSSPVLSPWVELGILGWDMGAHRATHSATSVPARPCPVEHLEEMLHWGNEHFSIRWRDLPQPVVISARSAAPLEGSASILGTEGFLKDWPICSDFLVIPLRESLEI